MPNARPNPGAKGTPQQGQPSIKSQLKTINDAIQHQKFDEAIESAKSVLQKDSNHYLAHIFLGYSYDKTGLVDEAEKAYVAATKIKPADAQAWQGLVKLYERQGVKNLASYQPAVLKLAEIYRDADEMYKCQDLVDKFIDFVRVKGDRSHLVEAYNLILPHSPIYPALEGRVPHPARTFETVIKLLEKDDAEKINAMIGKRRGMIGTRIADVTLEVKREIYSSSRLPELYRQLINWTNDDDTRRMYEEKLLQYCLDHLLVSPQKEKSAHLQNVRKLAQDMVIIKHPFKLAWDITVDWQDFQSIKEWDVNILRDYCVFFPDSDLCKVLASFLTSDISPFPQQADSAPKTSSTLNANGEAGNESEDDEDGGAPTIGVPLTDEDRLLMIAEGISGADSLLGYRLAGAYYQHVEDYESNVETMHKARAHAADQRIKLGMSLRNTDDAFTVYLATALVFHQSPRNHQEAKALFDRVLEHDPTSTDALIGVGLIYEEEEEYDEAIKFLERALQRNGDNLRVRTEAAWVHSLKGGHEQARNELEACIPLLEEQGQPAKGLLAQTQYRLGVCLWNVDTSRAWRKDRTKAYAQFIKALKNDMNYAPAYTSLGLYYADYGKDKKRARRCFQKAVELSPSEVVSAERLARSFADEGDWDRVELIAQRVVDSGKVKPPPGSKRKGISWPFAALGVALMNKQDFVKAIVSFQSATRISWDDYHSFVGLGESYHSSGKHFSAIKAIHEAQKLETARGLKDISDTWFTKFLLGNVNRELGAFDEAIDLYQEVIDARPDEEGVAIAYMQTMVDNAIACIDSGYFGKAVTLANNTLAFASKATNNIADTFNFWKAVGDACSVFSSVQGKATDFPKELVQQVFEDHGHYLGCDLMKETDGVDSGLILAKGLYPDDEKFGVDLTRCLHATILAHKRAIFVSFHDIHAQAVAHYNLGWAEQRAHNCLPASLRKKPSNYQKAAVKCFKRAIELEAGNPEFWNALGVVTSSINPSVAQHSFVRSLYLNERSAHVWTNLGTLALLHNDLEMANKAFTNAQSNEPDYAHGWLGQGYVALLMGQVKEARGLFIHAMDLSEGSSAIVRQQYSMSVFDHVLSAPPNLTVLDLVLPISALGQLRRLRPHDVAYTHLFTLFQERIHDSRTAVPILEALCSALEADYEVTESPHALKRYALAKTDLARAYLAAEAHEQAAECGEMALQLSSDESDNELAAEERRRARLSAHLTVGLARYYSGAFAEAVGYFETALEESDRNPDAVCMLAQMLWAKGGEEARERARAMLFEVIEERPDHVNSVLLLGVIALLDEDGESLEAVGAELRGMQTSDEVTTAEQERVGEVLQAIAGLAAGEGGEALDARTQAQTNIMLHPHLPHGWSTMAKLAEEGNDYPAQMAVKVARKAIPPRGPLGAEELARAYAGTRRVADAQTSVMVAPWLADGFEVMADSMRR